MKNMKVLDLFSGCGGLSLGFKTAGFDIATHIEKEKNAYRSACLNIQPLIDIDGCLDITELHPEHPALKLIVGNIDVVIGGPPCQAYSIAGRGKLASLSGIGNAHLADSRGNLYIDFLKICDFLKPKAILMENVPAILNYGEENLPETICQNLSDSGYHCSYTILNSASYGVPQYRERVFIMAFSEKIAGSQYFPSPTHSIPDDKNLGYKRILNLKNNQDCKFAVLPPNGTASSLPPALTAGESLDDLPFISTLDGSTWKYSQDKPLSYRFNSAAPFVSMMRNWPGLEPSVNVTNNSCRNTPRDFPIFSRMKEGDKYPEALSVSEKILNEKIAEFKSVNGRSPDQEERNMLRKSTVPPYDPEKFFDKWRKLEKGSPSHTIVAHLSVDTYSHIHYDSKQARGITVREAARLQSFPDSFRFVGNLKESYSQIGNAVPPLLSFHIARHMKKCLSE